MFVVCLWLCYMLRPDVRVTVKINTTFFFWSISWSVRISFCTPQLIFTCEFESVAGHNYFPTAGNRPGELPVNSRAQTKWWLSDWSHNLWLKIDTTYKHDILYIYRIYGNVFKEKKGVRYSKE